MAQLATPLVFLAAGGMGPSTTIAYKRLAALLAEKRGQKYSVAHDDVAETQAFVQPPAICRHCNQRPQDCKIHKLQKKAPNRPSLLLLRVMKANAAASMQGTIANRLAS